MTKLLAGSLAAALLLGVATQAHAEDGQVCLIFPAKLTVPPVSSHYSAAMGALVNDAYHQADNCQPDDVIEIMPLQRVPDVLDTLAVRFCRFDRTITLIDGQNLNCVYRGKPRITRPRPQG